MPRCGIAAGRSARWWRSGGGNIRSNFGFTSTLVETVERPEVEAAAARFLASLDFSGLVEIEFKYDARDSSYKILDVNARAWTWIALGAAAGIDFPALQYRLAFGENVGADHGAHRRALALS